MNVGFYLIIFRTRTMIGPDSGWGKYEFFVFLATTWLINSIVQAFFMPNAQEFSELIRTGNLGFRAAQADRHAVPDFASRKSSGRRCRISPLGLVLLGVGLVAAGRPRRGTAGAHALDRRCCTCCTWSAAWRSCTA